MVQIQTNIEKNVFLRHRGPVTSVKHIPGSESVITTAYDGAIGLFNLQNKQVNLLGYHKHLANSIVVNSNGTKAASCSADYTIYIWDLESYKIEQVLYGHNDDVESFIFVEDSIGVSASRDQRILIWDLKTGAIKRVIDGHEKDVLSLAYYDGKIYSSGDDKTLRVWDLDNGNLINMWGPFDVETDTCAIDVKRERVILGCDDGFIRVFDITNGVLVCEIQAHDSAIKKVAVSPATGDILSAAYDQRLIIWSAEDFSHKLDLENNPIKWERSLDFSCDGSKIFAGTFDGTVLIWDSFTGEYIEEVGNLGKGKGNACFNDVAALVDGNITLVSDDGYLRVVNLHSKEELGSFEPSSGRFLMNGVASDKEGTMVVSGSHNQKVHIFKNANNQLINHIETFLGEGPINTIRISEHSGFEKDSFVGCYSGSVVRVNQFGQVIEKLSIHDGAVKSLRLHPSKALGVSCSAGGELVCWDFKGNKLQSYLGHTAIINDLDISPSGNYVSSVSRDFTLKVFEFETGRLVYSFDLGRKSLKSVIFISDSLTIVGDYWGNIIKVDLLEATVTKIKLANNGISSITLINNSVIAVSYDGSINILDPESLELEKISIMEQRLQNEVNN